MKLVEIVEASSGELDVARYVFFARDLSCGEISAFDGTRRDLFEVRRVVELRYEAYVPMPLRQLHQVYAAARSRWAVERLAVVHRLVGVAVAEASVFVTPSSVHRAEPLAACEFVIEDVKASVPICLRERRDLEGEPRVPRSPGAVSGRRERKEDEEEKKKGDAARTR
ncbi:unnamed protein product [Spirodela intermedia]|uniref:Uncharacterized protein n=1 Tax=Spirodela intermedia TaxID=51605 RepID=A0A7I8IYN3_SPIIN|nr:unnamed protein product [Spirodela intermedia]CAA6662122.1 unnamed protein product [Spirodela intermedia]